MKNLFIYFIFMFITATFSCQSKVHNEFYDVEKGDSTITGNFTQNILTLINEGHHFRSFCEGYALTEKNEKWGYVNKDGKLSIPCIYDDASNFHNGLARVGKDGKYGFINKNGKVVVPLIYDNIYDDFEEGYVSVENHEKYGFVDSVGSVLTPCKYDFVESFCGGRSIVREGKHLGVINTKGEVIIPLEYDEITLCNDSTFFVIKNEKYGYIDKDGNILQRTTIYPLIDEDEFTRKGSFGLTPYKEGKLVGFKDYTGKVAIKPQWIDVIPFQSFKSRGDSKDDILWALVLDKKCRVGVINTKGEYLIRPEYELYTENDWHFDYYRGYFIFDILINNKISSTCYDIDGNCIVPPGKYGLDFDKSQLNNMRMLFHSKSSYGIMKMNGEVLFTIKQKLHAFHEGYAKIEEESDNFFDRRYGFIDEKGRVIFPCIFEDAEDFSEGIALVTWKGKQGFVDKFGNSTFLELYTHKYANVF